MTGGLASSAARDTRPRSSSTGGRHRLARVPAPAACSSPSSASTPTGTTSPPRRSRPAPSPRWHPRRSGRARHRRQGPAAAFGAAGRAVRRPGCRTPASSASPARGQDLHQGPARAGARPRAGPTVAPAGSFNNELGVPLTVCGSPPTTRFLVVEMGARGIGHIAYLARIAPPQIGVVLNVGTAHLGEFGSRARSPGQGRARRALPRRRRWPCSTPTTRSCGAMAARTRRRVRPRRRGRRRRRARRGRRARRRRPARVHPCTRRRAAADVTLRCVGEHHVGNALAAAAVALELGLSLDADRGRPVGGAAPQPLADGGHRARRTA